MLLQIMQEMNILFFLDENGKILNVIAPNPKIQNVNPITDLPELNIETTTGFGAILKAQLHLDQLIRVRLNKLLIVLLLVTK